METNEQDAAKILRAAQAGYEAVVKLQGLEPREEHSWLAQNDLLRSDWITVAKAMKEVFDAQD